MHVAPIPFPTTFEEFAEQVRDWRGLYFEMDGSFVWTGSHETDGRIWQLDGMLYDADGKIQYLELKGTCPRKDWLDLLHALTPSFPPSTTSAQPSSVVAHLIQQEAWVPARDFPMELPAVPFS